MMAGDQTHPIENASGASLLQLQYAVEHCREEGQYLSTTFLVACSELQPAPHIWLETIVLDMFTGSLRTQNLQVRCVTIDGHIIDIAQHICAKLRLILTVVIISRPIGH